MAIHTKRTKNFRLTNHAVAGLARIAKKHGISLTAALEIVIREAMAARKISVSAAEEAGRTPEDDV